MVGFAPLREFCVCLLIPGCWILVGWCFCVFACCLGGLDGCGGVCGWVIVCFMILTGGFWVLRVGSGGLGSSWWCLVGLGSLLRVGGYLIVGLDGSLSFWVCWVWWWGSFGGLGLMRLNLDLDVWVGLLICSL